MVISTGGGRRSCRPRKAGLRTSSVESKPGQAGDRADDDDPRQVSVISRENVGAERVERPVPLSDPGRETPSSTAAGVRGAHPAARSSRAISTRLAMPISTTIVALPGASERRIGPYAGFGVTGDHQERGREPAMRDGNPRQQRRRNRAGDAGNDLAGNAGRGERERLFPAAPEDERIAALETHDAMAAARLADHQPVDRVLANRRAAGALADEEPPRARGVAQRRRLDERVVEHEVRLAEPPHRLEREQLRIAGAGADERDEARHFTGSTWAACQARPRPGTIRPLAEPVACAAARAADCLASYSEFSASSSSGRRASIGT